MGNRGNATYVEKAAYLGKWTDTYWITWKCPRFQRVFRAKVKEKNMGKTHIRNDFPSIYVLMTLFHSYLAGKFVSSFPAKAFFLQLDLYWQPHSYVARLFSGKIIDNHSLINMDFIWLVTWSGFKRFWIKRIYRLKNRLLVIIIFFITKIINQVLHVAVHVPVEITFVSFLFASHPYLNWWHIFFFQISFLNFWLGSFWCTPFLIDLLSWSESQHADDPCLGYFWKKFLLFRPKESTMEFLLMFQGKQTWPYIILNYDCLIFREINSRNRFQRFQILDIFFLFFLSSYLLLRLPFVDFQSNGPLFLFSFDFF